jgi:hypothetical protein
VKGNHETMLMKWVTNFNNGIDHLAFECQTNHIWAQTHDFNTEVKCYAIRDISETFVVGAKFQCLEEASKIVAELHTHFPLCELHEALGIVYSLLVA